MRSADARFGAMALGLAALLLAAPRAWGQPAYLVRDITPGLGSPQPLVPAWVVTAGSRVLELASPGFLSPYQLWSSDGTPSGTIRLPDPGASPRFAASALGLAFFFAGSNQLWRSDGTRGGTYPLLASGLGEAPKALFDSPASVSPFHGALYFLALATSGKQQLWRTDGTAAGTSLVAETGYLANAILVAAGGRLFLLGALDQAGLPSLWISDGTAKGTVPIHAFSQASRDVPVFAAAGGRFFFEDGGLWASDGTPGGTVAVTRFTAPGASVGLFMSRAVGARLFFVADDGVHGPQIWVSDGTAAGTVAATALTASGFAGIESAGSRAVFVVREGPLGSAASVQLWATSGTPESTVALCTRECGGALFDLTRIAGDGTSGDRVVFLGSANFEDLALWTTDGTPQGTVKLQQVCAAATCDSAEFGPGQLAAAGNAVYFNAKDPSGALEPWRSDGTPAGTRRFGSRAPDPDRLAKTTIGALGGRLFFTALDQDLADQLWTSDGTAAGTRQLTGARMGLSSNPEAVASLGDQVFFIASTAPPQQQLWHSDGTAGGTAVLAGPPPGHEIMDGPMAAAGTVFFVQPDDAGIAQLWRTDGSAAGTRQLTAFGPEHAGPGQGIIGNLVEYQGRLVFTLRTGFDLSLWQSDGTAPGTAAMVTLPPAITGVDLLASPGDLVYLVADDSQGGQEVWRSDGTAAATFQLTSFGSRKPPPGRYAFVRTASAVYFIGWDGTGALGSDLWRTDGAAAGTVGLGLDDLTSLSAIGDQLYGLAPRPGGPYSLWRSDGTAAGTVFLKDFPGELASGPYPEFTAFSGKPYFVADDGMHGRRLWTSDGTAAGTVLVSDVLPGLEGANPAGLTVAGGRLFFAADDGAHGVELWQSDGSPAGTRMVQDLFPGPDSSSPSGMTQAGNLLFFAADDGLTGRELWALPLTGGGACRVGATSLCLQAGRFAAQAFWRIPQAAGGQDAGGPGVAVALTGDTGYFWFFSPDNAEVLTKVLDGRQLNGSFWVFYGALSNVEYWLTYTDTQTGIARRYYNPPGELASVGDTAAFGPQGAFSIGHPGTPTAAVGGAVPARAARAADVAPEAGGACQPIPSRLCLNGSRFAVSINWTDFSGHSGQATGVPLTDETGTFWFFDPANVEIMIKVLDGRAVNGKFWVFYGAMSNVQYTVTVTDILTGAVKTYPNPIGQFASVADTDAF
jgi:ELWxxDGT repeat protein